MDQKLAAWANSRTGFALPDDEYPFAAEVGKGGGVCSRCKYVSEDGKRCSNKFFIKYRTTKADDDSGTLPKPADVYCCNAFKQK